MTDRFRAGCASNLKGTVMSDLRRFFSPAAADSGYGDLNREAYDPIGPK